MRGVNHWPARIPAILGAIIGCAPVVSGQGCHVPDHYGEFIVLERTLHEGQSYFSTSITDAPEAGCVGAWVNRDKRFVDYLVQNFPRNVDRVELSRYKDEAEMNAAFIRGLQADTAFNGIMQGWVDKATDRAHVADTISMAAMLDVAVKFFSIYRLDADGRYVGKICVGLNDVAKTEEVRRPYVEAFCFSAIFGHLDDDAANLYDEFRNTARQLYEVSLGIDPGERLLRAQGAMYFLMRASGPLRQVLLQEYDRKKDWLPFVLTDP
ncbi:MAG: hypothetical protein J5I62_12335 [Flavobacteriales bacterium]|nr:hypothetical protein [Flavobacteriales bacterium]MEB2342000.1 hypothetical protein [Flavobacteriia bacterium]